MKKLIISGFLLMLITTFFVSGCKKAETPKPAEQPATAPTEPAPAPGEEGAK